MTAAPVLFSRMRWAQHLERLPLAAQLGPRLLAQYRTLGGRIDGGYLPITTGGGEHRSLA